MAAHPCDVAICSVSIISPWNLQEPFPEQSHSGQIGLACAAPFRRQHHGERDDLLHPLCEMPPLWENAWLNENSK